MGMPRRLRKADRTLMRWYSHAEMKSSSARKVIKRTVNRRRRQAWRQRECQ